MREQVLGRRTISYCGKPANLVVFGGLHYIKGNSEPYFSLTGEIKTPRGRELAGGCLHEEILRAFPKFKPLAELHLSGISGAPMHAEENAWYWLAGSSEPFRSRVEYNGGSGSSAKSHEECLRIFAEHVRVSLGEAELLRQEAVKAYLSQSHYQRVYTDAGLKAARAWLAEWIEQQRPRWKLEAERCIAELRLKVYGDVMTREQELQWATEANQEEAA